MKILAELSNAVTGVRLVETTEGRRVADARMLGCPQEILDRVAAKNAAIRTNYNPDNHYLPEEKCVFPWCDNEALPQEFTCEECKRFECLLDGNGKFKPLWAELLVDGKVPEKWTPSYAPFKNES